MQCCGPFGADAFLSMHVMFALAFMFTNTNGLQMMTDAVSEAHAVPH